MLSLINSLPSHNGEIKYSANAPVPLATSIFKDVRLRQAVAMGVDRQGIYDRVANGTGALAEYFISPLWEGKYLDKQYTMPARDVEARCV